MASIREQILTAMVATLNAGAGVGATVYRSRATALNRAEFPAVVLEPVGDAATDNVHTKTDWNLTVRIAILVKSETPDQAADAILVAVHEAVMSNTTWGGLAMDTAPSTVNWDLIEADVTTGIVPAAYMVQYRTDQQHLDQV